MRWHSHPFNLRTDNSFLLMFLVVMADQIKVNKVGMKNKGEECDCAQIFWEKRLVEEAQLGNSTFPYGSNFAFLEKRNFRGNSKR